MICQGKQTEALAILRHAAKLNGKEPEKLFPNDTFLSTTICNESQQLKCLNREETYIQSLSKLMSPKWRFFTLKIWGLWAGMGFAYYGSVLTITEIFASSSAKSNAQNEKISFDYGAILFSSLSELLGTILVIVLIDKMGRVPIQVLSYLFGGTFIFLLCFSNGHSHHSVIVCYAFLTRMFEMMASCVTWVLTAELLPTELRSSGHSAANAIGRIGAFFSPFLVASDYLSLRELGIIMFIVHVMTSICVFYLPETSGTDLGLISFDPDKKPVDKSYREMIDPEIE